MIATPPDLVTADVLASTDDRDVDQVVYLSVLDQIKHKSDREAEVVRTLPIGHQTIFMTCLLENEVLNGGLLQYFFNTRGEYAEETLAALSRVGAADHEDLLSDAMEVLLREAPELATLWKDGSAESFLRSYEISDLDQIDTKWYNLPKLETLRVNYIRAHPEEFSSAPIGSA